MKILHLLDYPPSGGARVAAEAVIQCVGGSACTPNDFGRLTLWVRAVRTVGGFCDPVLRRRMRAWLLGCAPEFVHIHNFKEFGTAAIAACKDLGIPVVWSCYDYWCLSPRDIETSFSWRTYQPAKGRHYPPIAKLPLLGRQRRIMRWMNRLDAVIALSEDSKRRLRDGGLVVPQIHVVPLPVTVPKFEMASPLESAVHVARGGPPPAPLFGPVPGDRLVRDPNLVLFVGGHAPHKGKHIFDAAMKIVQSERHEAVGKSMVGANRHQVLREIARAACLVVPEQWPNPGPVVVVEAQLLGTPVVASNIGGIPELRPYRLCGHNDPRAFAGAISEIISMYCPWHAGEAWQEIARRRHGHAVIREKITEVYASCAY